MSVGDTGLIFPWVHSRRVSFGDTDPAGIVYTPRFSDYCMEAAEVWFDHYLGVNWATINLQEGRGTPVVNMEITYTAMVRASDRLDVTLSVEKVGRSTITVLLSGEGQAVGDSKPVSAFLGRFVFCFTDNTQRSMEIPAETQEKIERYIVACNDQIHKVNSQ